MKAPLAPVFSRVVHYLDKGSTGPPGSLGKVPRTPLRWRPDPYDL